MANYKNQLKNYKFAVILIFLGIIQGCYGSNSTNDIKIDEKAQSSIIAEQATARNTYANCIAATPTNLKANIEAKYKAQCDQDYKMPGVKLSKVMNRLQAFEKIKILGKRLKFK